MFATEKTALFTLRWNVRHKYELHCGNLKYNLSAVLVGEDLVYVTLVACVETSHTYWLMDVKNDNKATLSSRFQH
jgi:hypothetical protein